MKKMLLSLCLVVSYMLTSFQASAQVVKSDVKYWVGSGLDTAILVVHWDFAGEALVWGYCWDSSNGETVYGQDMLYAIAAADANFGVEGSGFIDDFTYEDSNCLNLSLSGYDSDDFGYWMYAVNNSLGQVGIAALELSDGDLIYWRYCTTDYNVGAISPSVVLTYPVSSTYAVEKVYQARLCEGEAYNLNGFTIAANTYEPSNTAYTVNRLQTVSCDADTNHVLLLTVDATYEINSELTINESDLPYTYGQIVIEQGEISGMKQYTLASVNGCDSVINLNLTINAAPTALNDIYNSDLQLYTTRDGVVVLQSASAIAQTQLFTANGMLIESVNHQNTRVELSLNNRAKGIYLIKVTMANGETMVRKIIL